MTSIEESVIARLRKNNQIFEILVDCEKALAFKEGKASLDDALTTKDIYKDVKKDKIASDHELKKIFDTSDTLKIAEEIIKIGEIQLTAEYRNKVREEKRKAIINNIHRNCINPQTGLPHPPERIRRAIDEAKIGIDEKKKPEEQIHEIVEAIAHVIPIKIESRELEVKVPVKFASQSYRILKNYGKILKDEWQNDGSLVAKIEIPSGLHEEFETELNKLTHGEMFIKILQKK